MNSINPKVDFYFVKAGKWREALEQLRMIVLDCGLTEELKWGVPCYTYQKSNIVLIHVFKEYCALLFHKGVLLEDPKGILVQQTENVQSARQVRFTSSREVIKLSHTLRSYIQQAIEVEKSGRKPPMKKVTDYKVPDEFQVKLKEVPALKKAFEALTPGRQRGYLLHFAAAKQSTTRQSRVEKCMPRILEGKGLDD